MTDLARISLGGQAFPVSSFTMDVQNPVDLQPLDRIPSGQFEVSGQITVTFVAPPGVWRPRAGHTVFLAMAKRHMPKRRFRRLRGRVKAAVRRARA